MFRLSLSSSSSSWARFALCILLACGGGGVVACSEPESASAAAQGLDPKEAELSSLPVGLDVAHNPNPVRAKVRGRSGRRYSWVYATSVRATTSPVRIEEFGSFEWQGGRWVFRTKTGKPFTAADFGDWYQCPGQMLPLEQTFTDPTNWSGADELRDGQKTRWYFIGVDPEGRRVKGEAVVELDADLAD